MRGSFAWAYLFTGVVNLVPWLLAGIFLNKWLIVPGIMFATLILLGTMRAQMIIRRNRQLKIDAYEAATFRKSKTRPLMKAVAEQKASIKKR
jgi:hypothetical protein